MRENGQKCRFCMFSALRDVTYIKTQTWIFDENSFFQLCFPNFFYCKKIFVFRKTNRKNKVLEDFLRKIKILGGWEHWKNPGDLYFLERSLGINVFCLDPRRFLCILRRPTRSRGQIFTKLSFKVSKWRKTAKNGRFCPFWAIFRGFFNFSQKRL